jgi:hypothetical protein
MIKLTTGLAVGLVLGLAISTLPGRPEGTWTAATAATRAEVRPGATQDEIRVLAARLMENADYRDRHAARERIGAPR